MRLPLPLTVVLLAACASAPPVRSPEPARPVHTFSIVARDPATGELGVAVQSHWFSVGPLVPWAEPGVGAVATQSFVNVSFGPRGLALLRAGKRADEALAELIESDEGEAVRQVAIVDAEGRVAAHTGARCIAWAGHRAGQGYSAQGNILHSDAVVPAMAEAFESAQGELGHRLLAALEAGQAAGGDLRGRQSAALLVVSGERSSGAWEGRRIDLRVEDHEQPIAELRRLYTLHGAYERMNAGDAALEAGDAERAMEEYAAAAALAPDVVEIRFWNALTLATSGHLDAAIPIFREVFAAEPGRWEELLRRLPASGVCTEELASEVFLRAGRDDR